MRSRFSRPTGVPNAMADKKPEHRPAPLEGETRLAPDPFTAVLPALAALGAIASIATINWAAQERTPDRARSKRKAGTALRELETCCLGLAGDLPPLPAQPAAVCRRRRARLLAAEVRRARATRQRRCRPAVPAAHQRRRLHAGARLAERLRRHVRRSRMARSMPRRSCSSVSASSRSSSTSSSRPAPR